MSTHPTRALAAGLLLSLAAGAAMAQNCMLRDTNLRGRYDGDCARGWAHGQGRAEGKDRYEGAFMDGHAHGQGAYTFADGTRFEGRFVQGRVNGPARFQYPSGDVLEGEFRHDRLQGVGRLLRRGGETLLVEMRGGTLVPLPAVAAVAPPGAAQAPGEPAAAGSPAGAALPLADGPPQDWTARLDLDELFPSFILSTVTMKPPADGGTSTRGSATSATGGGKQALGLAVLQDDDRARAVLTNANVHYLGDPWGLVGIRLHNARSGAQVTVQVQAEALAEATRESFVLERVGEYALYPRLRYRFDRLRETVQPGPVNITWSVWVDGKPMGSTTRAARVRSVNEVPFVVITPQGRRNMTGMFTAFVTEDAPWVPELLREAMARHSQGAVGYQMGRDGVNLQVKAVYEMLQRRGVKYSSITDSSSASQHVGSQHVRFPSESLRGAEANCVDGTVLMATLLKRMGIDPVLITGPGHMLLGYRLDGSKELSLDNLGFVETTMVASAPFQAAQDKGRSTVVQWLTQHAKSPQLNFVSLESARAAGYMPISR
ncbi:hypothetical protein [Aquabacterium sp. OR-4]|uniref:hypothetical protein n=1 Tax=Aquabacterium sp. OR-4 TaxID=2978127 RepID=UPI0021B40615|nr:hypothetical protein [Aquabacterium sp. OR-4]MDT7835662.1 hypothetical protein [Aquabacterium sp. OR-4]